MYMYKTGITQTLFILNSPFIAIENVSMQIINTHFGNVYIKSLSALVSCFFYIKVNQMSMKIVTRYMYTWRCGRI